MFGPAGAGHRVRTNGLRRSPPAAGNTSKRPVIWRSVAGDGPHVSYRLVKDLHAAGYSLQAESQDPRGPPASRPRCAVSVPEPPGPALSAPAPSDYSRSTPRRRNWSVIFHKCGAASGARDGHPRIGAGPRLSDSRAGQSRAVWQSTTAGPLQQRLGECRYRSRHREFCRARYPPVVDALWGRGADPDTSALLITADAGEQWHHASASWKWELQHWPRARGRPSRSVTYPPGTSKWNKIEHRLFCIRLNVRGIDVIPAGGDLILTRRRLPRSPAAYQPATCYRRSSPRRALVRPLVPCCKRIRRPCGVSLVSSRSMTSKVITAPEPTPITARPSGSRSTPHKRVTAPRSNLSGLCEWIRDRPMFKPASDASTACRCSTARSRASAVSWAASACRWCHGDWAVRGKPHGHRGRSGADRRTPPVQ